jgi:hypothetical protein
MKRLMTAALALSFLTGLASVSFARPDDTTKTDSTKKAKKKKSKKQDTSKMESTAK